MLGGGQSQTPYDLHFAIFNIPVRVHPFFWIAIAILGAGSRDLFGMASWVLAAFLGVLLHELGHALTMQSFGFYPSITLYGLGGYTEFGVLRNPYAGRLSPAAKILITAAGPAAGFAIAAALTALLAVLRFHPIVYVGPPIGVMVLLPEVVISPWFTGFLNDLFFVLIAWGVLNLIPVLPLDGGQIARELLGWRNPALGAHRAAALSFVVGGAVAALCIFSGDWFLAVLFGYLAYINYAGLTTRW
ncbi:MAG: hypothetical protein GYA33_14240 [Thermogutta sp.]|nr:hypothetical protein [Thermogutta sp.]